MFDILDELRKEGLALHHTQTMTVLPNTPVASQNESGNPLLND
jgi:hypothetical protein